MRFLTETFGPFNLALFAALILSGFVVFGAQNGVDPVATTMHNFTNTEGFQNDF